MPFNLSLQKKTPTVEEVVMEAEEESKLEGTADLRGPASSSTPERDASSEEEGRFMEMQRGLKSRHIQLLALGGCIGTGLFVGTGATLSVAGPAPLFLGQCWIASFLSFFYVILVTEISD